jgi:tRNA A-37 threonylcarbamoyl transferase component Bud32/uncharacterized integral membrane protein
MATDNLTGQTLGQYQLKRLIGSGGMGAVYEANQTALNRLVAVKILSRNTIADPAAEQRFLREAQATAILEHPNIIPIYDFGVENSLTYVVMRLLNGSSLYERLHTPNAILPSLKEIAWLLEQIASGLDYAHQRGIIHRDIKPSNIMFDDRGTPYIVDFGIVRLMNEVAQSLTASGFALGTPSYMAPEMWRGETVTPAIDQYALGVVTYELLTGQTPFQAETPFALMIKHATDRAEPPQTFRPNLPAEAAAAVERALAKNVADRFPTVLAFARAFAEAVQSADEQPTGLFGAAALPPVTIAPPAASGAFMGGIETGAVEPPVQPSASMPRTVMPPPAQSMTRRGFPWRMILITLLVIVIVLVVITFFMNSNTEALSTGVSDNLTLILAVIAIVLAGVVLIQQRRPTSRLGFMQNRDEQMMEMTKAIAAEVAKETSRQIALEAAKEISREVAIEVRKEITKQFAIPPVMSKPTPPPLPKPLSAAPSAPTSAFKTFIQPIPKADRLFDVFLSYSRKDYALMCSVRDQLIEHGLRVWTDESLVPGTPMWDAAIEDAMEQSGCMVIILTPNTKYAEGVRNEIHYAKIHSVHIFSLLADGDEALSVPYPIIGRQWVDIRSSHVEGLQKVAGAIRQHLGN